MVFIYDITSTRTLVYVTMIFKENDESLELYMVVDKISYTCGSKNIKNVK